MGKSYKKTPVLKDNLSSKKKQKREANHILRAKLKNDEYGIANGNAYKKESESYDIADWVTRMTREEVISDYYKRTDQNSPDYSKSFVERFPLLNDYLKFWAKYYRRK